MSSTIEIPPVHPPNLWIHPETGVKYYFGQGDLPDDASPGRISEYYDWRRRTVQRIAEDTQRARAQQEAAAAAALADEIQRNEALREAAPPPAPLHHGLLNERPRPSRLSLQKSSPMPPAPAPTGPSYEQVIRDFQEDALSILLRVERISPDRETLADIDVTADMEAFSTIGRVSQYLKTKHFDGRAAKYAISLIVEGLEGETEVFGRWIVNHARDQAVIDEREIEREYRTNELRKARGLAPLPGPSSPGVPAPVTPAGVSTETLREALLSVQSETLKQIQAMMPQGAAAAAAGAPGVAPAAPVALEQLTPEKVRELVRETSRAAAEEALKAAGVQPQQPAAAGAPAAPAAPAKDPIDLAIEEAQKAKDRLAKLDEISGGDKEAPEPKPGDNLVSHNGITLTQEFIKQRPTMAVGALNLPMVQMFFNGVKDGLREIAKDAREERREEVRAQRELLEIEERKARLRQQNPGSGGESVASNGGAKVSSDWAEPRGRKEPNHGNPS